MPDIIAKDEPIPLPVSWPLERSTRKVAPGTKSAYSPFLEQKEGGP